MYINILSIYFFSMCTFKRDNQLIVNVLMHKFKHTMKVIDDIQRQIVGFD